MKRPVTFIVLVIVCFAVAVRWRNQQANRLFVELQKHGLLTSKYSDVYPQVMQTVAENCGFGNHWQINSPPRDDYLHLFVVAPGDAPGSFSPDLSKMTATASYVGHNSLICNRDFVTRFIRDNALIRFPDDKNRRDAEWALLFWIIGHEVGHALLKHKPADFAENNFTNLAPVTSFEQEQEIAADSFVAGLLKRDPQHKLACEDFLLDLVNLQIRSRTSKIPAGALIYYDYANQTEVEYFQQGSHPGFLYRGVRLLLQLSANPEDSVLNTELLKLARLMKPAGPNH